MKFATAILTFLWCVCLMVSMASCGKQPTEPTDTTPTTTADDTAPEALDLTYSTDYTATHTAEISIQNYGVIKLELDANMAPETVAKGLEAALKTLIMK